MIVLITGASSGLGRGMAREFAAMGRNLALCARRTDRLEELKQELGLNHYEGRGWRGFHHHASLCIAAYGFLMRERLSGAKKNSARFKTPAVLEGFRPRGAGSDAAARAMVDRDLPLPTGPRRRAKARAVPLLRAKTWRTHSLLTQ